MCKDEGEIWHEKCIDHSTVISATYHHVR